VVEERGVRDKTTVVVFDAAARALADMSQGQIDAMVVQNPYQMGDLSVKLMRALTKKDGAAIQKVLPSYDPETGKFKQPDGDVYHTELRVVVPNKESPLKADLFRPETKFFYFDDFKKWLDERHLVSS
jgi:ribose transport system substrate-binding protein